MANNNTIIKLSYDAETIEFFNVVVKSLIDLLDQKGSHTEVGQLLKKTNASVEIYNAQVEQFVPINTVFKRKEVKLPLWIK